MDAKSATENSDASHIYFSSFQNIVAASIKFRLEMQPEFFPNLSLLCHHPSQQHADMTRVR
jgi:hypothetical protein